MANTIKITPDQNGRLIIRLYDQDFDVTNLADENGKGSFKKFGEEYQFETVSKTRKRIQQALKEEEKPEDAAEEKADEN